MARSQKKLSEEQLKKRRREQKRDSMRRAREKLQQDIEKHEEIKCKDRERYKKNKDAGKVKLISQMTEREKRKVRKEWKKRSRKYRESVALKQKVVDFVQNHTPPSSPVVQETMTGPSNSTRASNQLQEQAQCLNANERRGSSRKNSGMKIAKQRRQQMKKHIKDLKAKLKKSEKKEAKLRQRIHRLTKKSTTQAGQNETPSKKVERLLKGAKNVSRIVKRKLLCGELLQSELKSKYVTSTSQSGKRTLKAVTCGKVFQKYRVQGYLTSLTGTSRWKTTTSPRQTARKIGLAKARHDVHIFLEKDESSRLTAGKKETVTRNKQKRQIRLLNDSMKELYKKYLIEHPHYKDGKTTVSYQLFCKLRPFWVLPPNAKSRQTCLCKIHANMSLIVKKMKALRMIDQATPQQVTTDMCCENVTEKCLERKCENCKKKTIQTLDYEPLDKVTYEQWVTKKVDVTIKGTVKKCQKTVKDIIDCSKLELFTTLLNTLPTFMQHVNNVKHQHETIDYIKQNLQQREALLHFDFSENYNCKYVEEIQSTHFGASKKQLSLHTCVLYCRSSPESKTESFCLCTVTENLRHDPAAICIHLKPVFQELKKHEPNLETLHILSDGPTTQYRNKKMFHLLGTFIPKETDAKRCIWHFSESGHGKGAPDGVGGTLKRTADNLVATGHDITGQDTFVSLIKYRCPGITVIGIENNEGETEMKRIDDFIDQEHLETFKGTMKVHQIIWSQEPPLNGQHLAARRLSCVTCKAEERCIHFDLGTIRLYPPSSRRLSYHEVYSDSSESSDSCNERNDSENIVDEVEVDESKETHSENDFVLVRFSTSKKNVFKHYVGVVLSVEENSFEVKFLRKAAGKFVFPQIDDICQVEKRDIVCTMQEPIISTRGHYKFPEDLSSISNLG